MTLFIGVILYLDIGKILKRYCKVRTRYGAFSVLEGEGPIGYGYSLHPQSRFLDENFLFGRN